MLKLLVLLRAKIVEFASFTLSQGQNIASFLSHVCTGRNFPRN